MHCVQKAAFHVLALAGLCAAALTARAQDEDDIVKKADKSTVTGKIESEDLKGISIKVGGKAQIGVGWKDIKSIQYAGAPELRKARGLVDLGNMKEAIPLLEDQRKKTDLRPILKYHVLNLLGGCYLRVGDLDRAVETYTDLFKQAPKSQFVIQGGGENLINAHLAKKPPNIAGANSALQLLLDGMKAAGQDTTPLNALRGRVQEESGDFVSAAATYNTVLSGAADAEAKAAAELGIARCLWGQKKTGEAESKYRSLTSKELHPLVLAGAWNGLGDIMMQAGREKSDVNLLTDALYAYLRGCVLYVPASGESTNEYERAVFGASNCFKALSEIETNADRKKLCAQRASERMNHLQTKFPGSRYLAGTK